KPAFDSSRMTALAAGIRAGKVDSSAIPAPAKSGDFTARIAARKTAMANALTTLHDTLTPDQRKALVDSMATKHAAFAAKAGEKRAPMQKGHGRSHDFMGGMLRGLDLTQAQKDAIHAKLSANRPVLTAEQKSEMKAQWTAKRETFRQDRQAKLQSFVSDS